MKPAMMCALVLATVAQASMREPDVVVTLRKIDPTGRELWTRAFPRALRPYRCEIYEGRVVVYLRSIAELPAELRPRYIIPPQFTAEVVFLDAATGQPAAAFDTRRFVMHEHDPVLARSSGDYSVLDERGEIVLPNKWTSYGLNRLPTFNAGPNKIYFFERPEWRLVWTLELPAYVPSFAHWKGFVIYQQGLRDEGKLFSRLYGHEAGREKPTWEFMLPADVPDEELEVFDVPGPQLSRGFAHVVGANDVFVLGNGRLFALDPATGSTRWRKDVHGDPLIVRENIRVPNAGIRETRDGLVLFSQPSGAGDGALVYFQESSRSIRAILRTDLYHGTPPTVHGNDIYCFTQAPFASRP